MATGALLDDTTPTADTMQWAERLRSARLAHNLSYEELSELAGVHRKTIERLEHHPTRYRVKWITLQRLAYALQIPIADLLEGSTQGPIVSDPQRVDPVAVDRSMLEQEVLLAPQMAKLLRTSLRAFRLALKAHPESLPATLPTTLDGRPRWSRAVVVRWLAGDLSASGSGRRRRR